MTTFKVISATCVHVCVIIFRLEVEIYSKFNNTDQEEIIDVKGARSRYLHVANFCLILSIMSSRRQIGRAKVFHLQNQGHITTKNDFPAV